MNSRRSKNEIVTTSASILPSNKATQQKWPLSARNVYAVYVWLPYILTHVGRTKEVRAHCAISSVVSVVRCRWRMFLLRPLNLQGAVWHYCVCNSNSCNAVPVNFLKFGITVYTTPLALRHYRLLPLQLAPLFQHSAKSDEVPVTCLTVGTTVLTTELTLMQYRLLALQFGTIASTTAITLMQFRVLALNTAPLYLEQHHLWFSNGYLYYIWHYCACNSTSSNAVPFTTLELASI
jgi:hypothetical protein